MDDVVHLIVNGRPSRDVPVSPGDTLAQALFRAGCFIGRPLCSGIGRCGLCRVRFLTRCPAPAPQDARRLSSAELEAGWRLSCAHAAGDVSGAAIEVPSGPVREDMRDRAGGPVPPGEAGTGPGYFLGLDLGTTGLAFRAVPASGRGRIVEGQAHNPQLGAGSEVMSRLAFASRSGGAELLRGLVLDFLRRVIGRLPGPVERLGVAGNPAMMHLFLGLDFSGLAAAPYRLSFAGGREMELAPDLPRAYVPPLLGPFVGADASAGVLAVLRADASPPFLLVDLGTNGEFVLALPDGNFLAASVPMGPALEGVGPRLGRLAGPGTAVAFELSPGGLSPVGYGEGNEAVTAIGGTGYLSLLARLRAVGALGEDGRFTDPGTASPLGRRILAGLGLDAGEPRLDVAGVSLWASDVEEILKVKAACNLAFSGLFRAAGIGPGELSAVYLAGAFGSHVNPDDLEELGMLPSAVADRCRCAGNTSLDGVCLLTADPQARREALELARRTTVIDLAAAMGGEEFGEAFIKRMVFRYVA
ncbi:MAG: ASKHA domain-containing protein [Thermodesulfobacteriota bacterium]